MSLPIQELKNNVSDAIRMDVKTYQFPYSTKQYRMLANMQTQLAIAVAQQFSVGFVVWDRGSSTTPAVIYRLGVVPELVVRTTGDTEPHYATARRFDTLCVKRVASRRHGLGRKLFQFVEDDVRKAGLTSTLQLTVSSNQARGKNDPDDVSVFLGKMGMSCSSIADGFFEEYGSKADAYIFRKSL